MARTDKAPAMLKHPGAVTDTGMSGVSVGEATRHCSRVSVSSPLAVFPRCHNREEHHDLHN